MQKHYSQIPPEVEQYIRTHYVSKTAGEMGKVLGMTHDKVRFYIRELKLLKHVLNDVLPVSELMRVNPKGIFEHDSKLFTI